MLHPTPRPAFFFFFGVSDRLIKDYNLSSSEGQRIGLAISNLIFFQVAAKPKFVLPNKMIFPIHAAWNSMSEWQRSWLAP